MEMLFENGGSMDHYLILAYVGPETILPLASILGAIVGVLLMIWHRVIVFAKSIRRWFTG